MFTKFHNVSFITNTVTGLEVEGKTLVIHTVNSTYEVPFQTGTDAQVALEELTDILNNKTTSSKKEDKATKTDDILNLAQDAVESLQGVLGTLRTVATAKVADCAVQSVLDRIDGRLSSILDAKDDIIAKAKTIFENAEPENKPQSQPKAKAKQVQEETKNEDVQSENFFGDILNDIFTGTSCVNVKVDDEHGAKKISVEEFKQVFGTEFEPLIGDLTDKQLREFISEFVDGALENERVQALFNNIKEQFGTEEAESAIEGYKKLIYTFCNQNVEMTLSQVIARYFS